MKKIGLAIFVGGILQASTHGSLFQGIHVSALMGFTNTVSKVVAWNASGEQTDKVRLSLMSFKGGMAFSYLHALKGCTHLGVDIEGNVLIGKTTNDHNAGIYSAFYTLKMREKSNYAASILMGHAVHCVLPYLKMGLRLHQYELHLYRNPRPAVIPHYRTKRTTVFSPTAAIGVQVSFHDNFLAGVEYGIDYLIRKKIPIEDDGRYFTTPLPGRRFAVKPMIAHSLTLRFTYRFKNSS